MGEENGGARRDFLFSSPVCTPGFQDISPVLFRTAGNDLFVVCGWLCSVVQAAQHRSPGEGECRAFPDYVLGGCHSSCSAHLPRAVLLRGRQVAPGTLPCYPLPPPSWPLWLGQASAGVIAIFVRILLSAMLSAHAKFSGMRSRSSIGITAWRTSRLRNRARARNLS